MVAARFCQQIILLFYKLHGSNQFPDFRFEDESGCISGLDMGEGCRCAADSCIYLLLSFLFRLHQYTEVESHHSNSLYIPSGDDSYLSDKSYHREYKGNRIGIRSYCRNSKLYLVSGQFIHNLDVRLEFAQSRQKNPHF
jgi:hypothetical protein